MSDIESATPDDYGDDDGSRRPAAALCAHHPDRRASITCPLCGSFACGDCTVDMFWGAVMCEDCLAHGRAQYPLPWEQSLSPIAFVQSAYLLFAEAPHAFRHFPTGRVRRALAFALAVAVVLGLFVGTTRWLFAPRHWAAETPGALPTLGRALLAVTPTTLALVLVTATVFHVVATLLGGRAPFSVSLRAAAYLSVVQLLEVVNLIVDTILIGNLPITLIIRMVGGFFLVWGLSLLAEHRFGLPRGRAITAAIAPALLLLSALALLITVAWLQPGP